MGLRSSCCTKGCLPCELESPQHQIQPLRVTAFWTHPESCKNKASRMTNIKDNAFLPRIIFQNIFMDLYLLLNKWLPLNFILACINRCPRQWRRRCFYPVKHGEAAQAIQEWLDAGWDLVASTWSWKWTHHTLGKSNQGIERMPNYTNTCIDFRYQHSVFHMYSKSRCS